jgi:hypothetical protein
MYYVVQSAALPKARAFRNIEMAVAFAKSLAMETPFEVKVIARGGGYWYNQQELYVFNRRSDASPSPK